MCIVRQDKTLHTNTKKSNSNSRGSGPYHGFQVISVSDENTRRPEVFFTFLMVRVTTLS